MYPNEKDLTGIKCVPLLKEYLTACLYIIKRN